MLLFCGILSFAQEPLETSNWKKSGNASLLFNQATFSNWVLGGENNVSLNFLADYTLTIKKTPGHGTLPFYWITDLPKQVVVRFIKKQVTGLKYNPYSANNLPSYGVIQRF